MEWVTWPHPLFPAVGVCPLLAPASLRQHSGGAVAFSAVTERKKNTPCELKASATLNTLFSLIDDGFKSTYTLICLQFQLSFSKFASTVKSQS